MQKLIRIIILSLVFTGSYALLNIVQAASFNINIDREYTLVGDEELAVVERHTVKNNSQDLLISDNNTETFQITVISPESDKLQQTLDSIELTIDGVSHEFITEIDGQYADVITSYPSQVSSGQTMVFEIKYTNYGLVESQGALVDIYAPGFAEGFSFSKGETSLVYNTKVRVPKDGPETNFIVPATATKDDVDSHHVYTFPQADLVGNTIWIQLGQEQFYKFAITQQAVASDTTNTGYFNEYRLVLPRDIVEAQIEQKVYYTNIDPEPIQILEDAEGNLVGYFKIPSHESKEIKLEGYARVFNRDGEVNSSNSGAVSQYNPEVLGKYTAAANYWEVGAAEIMGLANQLKADKSNVYDIVESTYRHVIDTIDYSEVKRFGINERQGALKTLQGGAAVCMEYSDLFLTLSRAQGIPARAAFGYGYDSRYAETEQEAHQWVQILVPGSNKWMSVDVTWGESGPTLIGGDLNHFFTHVAATSPDNPSMVERVSYGEDVELNAPDFSISVVETLPNIENLLSEAQLLEKYPQASSSIVDDLKQIATRVQSQLGISNPDQLGPVVIGFGVLLLLAVVTILVKVFFGEKIKQALKRSKSKKDINDDALESEDSESENITPV